MTDSARRHIDAHLKNLHRKLAVTTNEKRRENIRQEIRRYEKHRERGTLPAECRPFVKDEA